MLIDVEREFADNQHIPVVVRTTPRRTQEYTVGLGYGTDTAGQEAFAGASSTLTELSSTYIGPWFAVIISIIAFCVAFASLLSCSAAAARLGREASELAGRFGASLLITTSARTKPETLAPLEEALAAPYFLYRWRPNDNDNPYFAFLGLADRIIVTGDSVSMATEACATGKPVYLFDLGIGWRSMRRAHRRGRFIFWNPGDSFDFRAFIYLMGMCLGPKRITRDIRIIHDYLLESGRAAWLGEGDPPGDPPPLEDISRAVNRVRALFPERLGRSNEGRAPA